MRANKSRLLGIWLSCEGCGGWQGVGGWRWGGFASVLRGGGNKHKSTTTTHKTQPTGRCKKNAEFTFSTSSPEVQQGPYYDDNAALNKLMANLALALPAVFFFLFFFHSRGPRLSQNRSAMNLPRQSLLPSLSLAQRICSSFSGASSTTPGSRKVSWHSE